MCIHTHPFAGTVGTAGLGALSVGSVVTGLAALGPLFWCAPEVLVPIGDGGVVATSSSDVYQFGGLMHEVLTAGDVPFWWMVENSPLLALRRRSEVPVRVPGTRFTEVGLKGKSTVEAAGIDDQPITLRVRMNGSEGSRDRLQQVVKIMEGCLDTDPKKRWKTDAL
jgi:serine/threonine protein kinase